MSEVMAMATKVPLGMAVWGLARSPEMFAPAMIPVAAGKKIEKTFKADNNAKLTKVKPGYV